MEYGGAERVLDSLLKIFPTADLYTFYYNSSSHSLQKYKKYIKGISFVQHIPYIYKLGSYFSIFKLLSWIYFLSLNLDKYDVIISSTHSYGAKMVRGNMSTFHMCYVHTTPRYLYGETHELMCLRYLPFSIFFYPIKYLLILVDRWGSRFPTVLIANSINTQNKIRKFYGKEAVLIYPPVSVLRVNKKCDSFFVTQARLVKQKGIKFIIKMCAKYRIRLVVIGDGYYKKELLKFKRQNIIFTGFINEKKLAVMYSYARALIYNASSDDFGLIPAEALARGIPVICNMTGGVAEIVKPGINGFSFEENNEKSFLDALKSAYTHQLNPSRCINSVDKFSESNFKKNIQSCMRKREKKI